MEGNIRDVIEVYKSRTAEYRERYERMRDTAWKILFETYIAYGVIGGAFLKVNGKFRHQPVVSLAVAATILFFMVNLFLWVRLNERLRSFDEMYEAYMDKIHALTKADIIPGPKLKFEYVWAFWPHIILSTATMLCLVAYIWFAKPD